MAASVRDLAAQLSALGYNAAGAQRAVLQSLSDITGGKIQVVDPSNPLTFALESACVLTMNAMTKYATLNRKQYAVAAQDQEDLYLHMSDVDYLGRFCTPATDTFLMMLPYAELLSKLVLDPTTGIKKIVIPRNTKITIANTVFMICYPIEIRQLLHGGLQVIYDTSETCPFQTLSDNLIKYELVSDGTNTYLRFPIQVLQIDGKSVTQNANAATNFSYQFAYNDQYYYTRVWVQNNDGTWTEIKTTHSDQVYDITEPTAVLQVNEDTNTLTVSIPQIYTATGVIKTAVRMDIYTSKGEIYMVLDNYSMGLFQITFQAFDQNDITPFTEPLSTLTSMFAYSTSTLAAGSNGLTFEELRSEVIDNSVGPQKLPITNVNLQSNLQKLGFNVISNIDNITNRIFLASRALPLPTDSTLLTAAGTSNATVSFSLDQLSGLSYVVDNTDAQKAMTLTPDALFKDVNGVVSLVSDGEIQALNALPPDQRALMVTNGNYLYTPFHYVLDSTGNNFAVRPYYLDDPVIQTKSFKADNDTTLLQVNTAASYGIVRTATGYAMQVTTTSSPTFQALPDDEIYVMLSFVPEGEKDRAFLLGQLVGRDSTGKERIYQFDLSSNMNVDAKNCIQLSQFKMFTQEPRLVGSQLTQDFDIIYATTAVMDTQWEPNEVDSVMSLAKGVFVPANAVGVTWETLTTQFGTALTTLWAQARSVVSTIQYEVWDTDQPLTYETDVYERDPVTGAAVSIVDGQVVMKIAHHKGDPVLDSSGNPVLKYTAGQIKLDPATGAPIPANPRGMTRQIDFMLIEGVYKFATDTAAKNYRSQMIGTLLTWMTGSLQDLSNQLLEQTKLYFYPKKTIGLVNIMIGASLKTTMQAGQSLVLTLYVDSNVYNNSQLRTQLTVTATQIVAMQLTQAQVANDAIEDALATAFGSDVIALQLSGLGGQGRDLPVFTILDDSIRASLRKKLIALTDDSLVLAEDLTVVFVQHDQAALTAAPAGM